MIPGWRIGWILIHDRNGAFQREVRTICVIVSPCFQALPYYCPVINYKTPTLMHSSVCAYYSCLVKVAPFLGPAQVAPFLGPAHVFRHL